MSKPKEVIFPQPLSTIVNSILQAAKEAGAKHPLAPAPDDIVSSLVSSGLSVLYNRWRASVSDGEDRRWGEFVRKFRQAQAASPDGKMRLLPDPEPYSRVVVLSLPHIPTNLLENEVLQRKFVRALGIPEDWCQWQNLSTSRPPCTALSAWGDANRVFCSVIRDQGSLWIKSDGRENTVEFLLLSRRYPGVAASLRFHPPIGKQDTPIEQLIPRGGAVIETSAFISPGLLLKDSSNHLQTPTDKDRFLEDLSRLFSKAG